MNKGRYAQFRKINLPIDKETLKIQEDWTNKVRKFAWQEPQEAGGNGIHYHKCLFCMLSNDKAKQYKQCREWRKKHNITAKFDGGMEWSDACDECEMMCYVALDDEGKLMYTTRFDNSLKI